MSTGRITVAVIGNGIIGHGVSKISPPRATR